MQGTCTLLSIENGQKCYNKKSLDLFIQITLKMLKKNPKNPIQIQKLNGLYMAPGP